jgi:hypothetical protein
VADVPIGKIAAGHGQRSKVDLTDRQAEICFGKVGARELAVLQGQIVTPAVAELCRGQITMDKSGLAQVGIAELNAGFVGSVEFAVEEACVAQVCIAEATSDQCAGVEEGIPEIFTAEVSARQILVVEFDSSNVSHQQVKPYIFTMCRNRDAERADERLRAAYQGKSMRVKRKDRLPRTLLLGALFLAAALYWLIDVFGLDRAELLSFVGLSVLLVAAMVALALLGVLVLRLIRRLFRRTH